MAVDRAEVLQPEILEQTLRLNDVLQALLDAVQRVVQRCADERGARECGLHDVECLLVRRCEAQCRQPGRHPTDCR